MADILDEAAAVVQCKECPWYRSCVMPLKFTPEEVKRQMDSASGGLGQAPEMQGLMASMAAAAQDLLLEACPIFIKRLRNSPNLAQKIKELMRSWGEE